MTAVLDDLMAEEAIVDPHSFYRALRDIDPVYWNDRWGGWVLTRYVEATQVLRDSENFSSDRMAFLANELNAEEREACKPIFDVLSRWMVFRDPPAHTTLRLLLNKLFLPREVEVYRPEVRRIVSDLLDSIEGKSHVEMVKEFAYLVPLTVILGLLGVPDLDREKIKHWSEQIGVFFFIRADEPRRREIACEGVNSLRAYLEPYVAERRKNPKDDVMSLLIRAGEEGKIEDEDIISTCVLMVFGGHETTMNLIANGTLALARHPEAWDQLKNDPSLLPTAVEELLRYDSPVKTTVRWARRDVEVGGKTIREGQRLLVSLAGANHDPDEFERPDELILTRDPNHHISFAHGIHVCIGASLARLEGQEAFLGLTQRMPCPVLETTDLEYHPSVVGRALKALPVRFD